MYTEVDRMCATASAAKNTRHLAMRDICRLSRLKENVRF